MNQPVRFGPANQPRDMRFTIAQFYQMQEAGVFEDFHKTELLDGRVSFVNSQFVPHMQAKLAVYDALRDCTRGRSDGLVVGMEGGVELGTRNLPEPDVFLWMRVETERCVPDGAVRLVVEIADSSERRDLGLKKRIYARGGIAEYWVVLLRRGRIERFAEPAGDGYARHDSFGFDEQVDAVTLPAIVLPAGTLG